MRRLPRAIHTGQKYSGKGLRMDATESIHTPLPRAVVVHTGGIGDLILSSPAIARLAQTHSVDLVGYPDRLALLVAAGIATRATALDVADITSLFSTPSPRVKAFFHGASRADLWMADTDGRLARVLAACGVPSINCHPGLPPASWTRHASAYYWEAMGWDTLGWEGEVPLPQLQLGAIPVDFDILIHPGSGALDKNWPWENYCALAAALHARGLRIAWSLGPAERERMQHINPAASQLPGALLPEMSLVDLGRRLASTRLYIGNDSGVTHLAASVACPVLSLFGPTNDAVWAARGPRVHILRGHPWPTLDDVLAAVDACMH